MYDLLLKMMFLAQSATPEVPVEFEKLTTQGATPGLSTAQWFVLAIYALVCLGLVCGVIFQTSKSEGLLQSSMSSAPTQPYKGKASTEDKLGIMTTYLAYSFLGLSILMALVFK